jgi:hypothetical protein
LPLFTELPRRRVFSETGLPASTGSLSSPVVLDQHFSVGRSFGASGTPSTILVDEEGKIASEVALGGPAVLEMARAKRTGL